MSTAKIISRPYGKHTGYRYEVTTHFLGPLRWYTWQANAYNFYSNGRARTYAKAKAQAMKSLAGLKRILELTLDRAHTTTETRDNK